MGFVLVASYGFFNNKGLLNEIDSKTIYRSNKMLRRLLVVKPFGALKTIFLPATLRYVNFALKKSMVRFQASSAAALS